MLVRWDPFVEFSRLHRDFFTGQREQAPVAWKPPVDIAETDVAFVVTAELPGVASDGVSIDVHNGVLTLKGERQNNSDESDEKKGVRRVERFHGSFARTFSLPETVDVEAINATMKDGLLTLTLPKREAAKPRKIAVQ